METIEQGTDFRPAWGEGGEAPTGEVGMPQSSEATESPTEAPAEAPADAAAGDQAATPEAPSARERRQSRFITELTRAMHAAAEEGRGATLEQLRADGKSAVEEIQTRSAEEASAIRHQADEDIAGIREWSKAEIARIREETEQRIASRKETLDKELEGHAAVVEAEVESVQTKMSTFESEMDAFFESLLAEEDPGRFAALAASMPEPPPFTPLSEAERAEIVARATGHPAGAGTPADETTAEDPGADAGAEAPEAEEAAADAAASVETDEAADAELPAPADVDPSVVALDLAAAERDALADVSAAGAEASGRAGGSISARLAGLAGALAPAAAATTGEEGGPTAVTQVVVTGLTSVSSIAAFKRQLGRLDGVRSVAVSSGPSGEFLFAVSHDPGLSVADGVRSLGGFSPEVTRAEEGVVEVSAHDPEA